MERADAQYFRAIVGAVCAARDALDAELAGWMDREPLRLDPIEHAVLLIGAYELKEQPDVPFRVVINEGVSLAKRFGATDGHKFVNAVLDRAARSLRPNEH
jgi:N utilization substance protein B